MTFMFAFMADQAIAKEATIDELAYDFTLIASTDADIPDTAFGFKYVSIVCGAVQDQTLTIPADKAACYQQLPLMVCKVVRRAPRSIRLFNCPLYRQAFIAELNEKDMEIELCEGESRNFVWECGLSSDKSEKDFTVFGTALFCRLPEQFAS
jgi:hypothetical protein